MIRSNMKLRASSLPLIAACPAAAEPSTIPVVSDSREARLGTAVHDVLAGRLTGKAWSAEESAAEWRVDAEEVGRVAGWAWTQWDTEVAQFFPSPRAEVQLSIEDAGIVLSGHLDVLSVVGDEVRVHDWKTGFVDADYRDQLMGYGLLALNEQPHCNRAYLSVQRIRDQSRSAEYVTRPDLDRWWESFCDRLKRGGFDPGPQCRYCPRRLECPAYERALVRSAAMLALDYRGLPNGPERAALIGSLHLRRKQLEKACELVRELERAEVAAAGGVLPIYNGLQLELVKQERRHIDFAKGWPVLIESDADTGLLMQAVSISKTKAEEAIKARQGRGRKSGAVRAVMDKLESAGALSVTTIERLELRRTNVHSITAVPANQIGTTDERAAI